MRLKPLIYRQALKLKTLNRPRVHYPNIFHASEAGDCTREIYFRRAGREPENSFDSKVEEARVSMLLNDGRMHQAGVTGYLQQAPGIHVTNIETDGVLVEGPIIITGHPDAIVHDSKTGEIGILEVKGLSTKIPWFTKVKFEDYNIDTLKTNYPKAIPQARVYMKMFGASTASIIIKDKNDSTLWEFEIEHDEKIYQNIVEKFKSIHKSLIAGNDKGVFCDFMKNDKRSKFCNYQSECGYGR